MPDAALMKRARTTVAGDDAVVSRLLAILVICSSEIARIFNRSVADNFPEISETVN